VGFFPLASGMGGDGEKGCLLDLGWTFCWICACKVRFQPNRRLSGDFANR